MADIIRLLRDLMRSQIPDPANRGSSWIFSNYPRTELGKDPIISIIQSDKTSSPFSLGNTAWMGHTMAQIEVWTKEDEGFTIDGTKYYDKDLCNTLADIIEYVMRNNWVSLGFQLFDMTHRTPLIYDDKKRSWTIKLTYEIQALE